MSFKGKTKPSKTPSSAPKLKAQAQWGKVRGKVGTANLTIPAFKGERKQGVSNVVEKVMSSEDFKKKNINKWTKFKIRI